MEINRPSAKHTASISVDSVQQQSSIGLVKHEYNTILGKNQEHHQIERANM